MLKNSVGRGENFLTPFLPSPSKTSSSELRKITPDNEKNISIQTRDIEKGLDYIFSHFEIPTIFPRTISTFKSKNYQIVVTEKEEIIKKYEESNFIDCRINAFPSLKEVVSWKSNFIFIDLDLADFKSKRSLNLALNKTLRNIKERVEGHPTVLETGGGYHIYQPMEGIEFVKYRDFNKFNDYNLFNEFLRFSKDFLSNGKADKNNNPSLKSCLLRIPNSINSKYNKEVLVKQEWNGFRPHVKLIIGNYLAYLVTKKQKEAVNFTNTKYRIGSKHEIRWIEKLLQTSIVDHRKYCLWRILCPYLINIKKLSYEEAYLVLKEWLEKCSQIRNLDFSINSELKNRLKKVNNFYPISYNKLIEENKDVLDLIYNK